MRSFLPDYELVAPRSLPRALEMLASDPGHWHPFAGGTDLMVLLEAGTLAERHFLSLWHLGELRGVEIGREAVIIGALTTYSDVLHNAPLCEEFPLLRQAASETGGVATQNRGTLGGNIANASPAADTPPALLVYDAELELISVRGARRVPYDGFHTGYKTMAMMPDELIGAIRLPRGRRWAERYWKVGTRRAQAISKVCFAGAIDVRDGVVRDVRIAMGSVGPTVIRAVHAEAALRGRSLDGEAIAAARGALAGDMRPIDDMRSTARYRQTVAGNLLEQFLEGRRGVENDENVRNED
jgi:CO/xanthine dehydrogenase FAD-binding subunit